MGAASYIGRIGGLAVALGVGTAIITGQGVAIRDPRRRLQDGASQSSGSQTGGQTKTNTGTATNDDRQAEDKNSGASEITDAIEPLQRRLVPSEQRRLFDDCQTLPTRPRSG